MEPNKIKLGEKLDLRFTVKFHCLSNADSVEAPKRYLDPELDLNGQMRGQKSPNLEKKVMPPFRGKIYG